MERAAGSLFNFVPTKRSSLVRQTYVQFQRHNNNYFIYPDTFMETQAQVLQLLEQHLYSDPTEVERLAAFRHFVSNHTGLQLYNRHNFTGHITASAFIINRGSRTMLLLHHKALNRWLQPGGHIDETDVSLLAAALREATEETGIPAAALQQVGEGVFDFDTHAIPANARKQEPAHFHHDVRFLFECASDTKVQVAAAESLESRWVPWQELESNKEFAEVIKKVRALYK